MLAFVFGGGGSRGALQVGALEALLQANIRPDMVIGTSVGSLNAAYLASNPTLDGLEHLKSIWLEMDETSIYADRPGQVMWNLISGRASLFHNTHWRDLLQSLLPVTHFSELQLPCYAVTTDVETAETIVFGDQPDDQLLDGLMGSTAMVPVHPPWEVGGRHYVDGGFSANLPMLQAIERGATEIIALNLTTQLKRADEIHTVIDMLYHAIDLLISEQVQSEIRSVRRYQSTRLSVIDLQYKTYLPVTDFSHTADLIQLGHEITVQALQ